MDIADWLGRIDLGIYAAAFRAHHVDVAMLHTLTADDLIDLGIASVGHRRRLLDAIATLHEAPAKGAGPSAAHRAAGDVQGPTRERRLITALFCDVVDSTSLAERLDPEDLLAILTEYNAAVVHAVTEKRGTVAGFFGDGVLGYFGWPYPDEVHAESAVRSALAILDALSPPDLAVRIGIATGLVVTGSLPIAGSAQPVSAVGQTLNLAARLQGLAEPNTIIVSEATRRQLGDVFSLTDLGMIELKGFDTRQRAWRVERAASVSGRSEALHVGRPTRLIGRDAEVAMLLGRWEQAVAGREQTLLLSGEAGIGKSRLLAEFDRQLAGQPHHTVRCFCSQHAGDSPLFPFIARWERDLGFGTSDPAETRAQRLEAAIAHDGLSLEELAALATLLSLPPPSKCPPLDPSPKRIKEQIFSALTRRIERLSEDRPVVLMFEDAHWADPSSLELLDYARARLVSRPVLLVVSHRPEFTLSLAERADVTLLTLGRLERRHSEALALQVIGRSDTSLLPLTHILDVADGVPLFIEELTKALLDGVKLFDAEGAGSLPVPQTLQTSLMARLDRMPLARQVAQTGAVVGREFTPALLQALARPREPELTRGLAELVESGLATQRADASGPSYLFKHALVQEVAYQSLLRSERRDLHGRLAAVLEDERPDIASGRPEVLAQHWSEAGAVAKAVSYWAAAVRLSIGRAAVREAASQTTKGLRSLAHLPETPERWTLELQLELSFALTCILISGFGASDAGEACTRARQLWDRLGRPAAAAGPVFYGAFFVFLFRAEFDAALRTADDLFSFAKAQGSPGLESMAVQQQIAIYLGLGEFATARDLCRRALVLDDPSHNASYGIFRALRPPAYPRIYFGRTLAYLGYFAPAAAELGTAVVEARSDGSSLNRAFTLSQAFFGNWAMSTAPALLQQSDELLAFAEAHQLHQFVDAARAGYGWCMIVLGRTEEGLAFLARSSSFRNWGTNLYEPFRLLLLADAYSRVGDVSRGLDHADEALALVGVTNERWMEPELLRVRGELLAASGDEQGGTRGLQDAIKAARRQEARAWELRSTLSLARLWRAHGELSEAQSLLSPIFNWFEDGFLTPDLQEAGRLLAAGAGVPTDLA